MDQGDFKHYNFYKNECCKDKNSDNYNNCTVPLIHEIDYKHNEKHILENNVFDVTAKYKGMNLIISNQIKNCKEHKIPYYESFIINSSEYKLVEKPLGKGAYGIVLQYAHYNEANEPKYIAVKYGNIKDELKVIEYMKLHGNVCSELLVKYIIHTDAEKIKMNSFSGIQIDNIDGKRYYESLGGNFNPNEFYTCIIMENATGTIDQLKPIIKNNIRILVDILYAIVIAIQCLYDIGLYYIDIKEVNILYYYTEKGIQIILGDLGGAVMENEKSGPSYPPYEYDSEQTFYRFQGETDEYYANKIITIKPNIYTDRKHEKERIITWGIGILTLMLLGIDFMWNSPESIRRPPQIYNGREEK